MISSMQFTLELIHDNAKWSIHEFMSLVSPEFHTVVTVRSGLKTKLKKQKFLRIQTSTTLARVTGTLNEHKVYKVSINSSCLAFNKID